MNRKERRAGASSNINLKNELSAAIKKQQSGMLREAERDYRKILQLQPNHQDALHLLGICLGQQGKNKEAEELIKKAISINQNNPQFYANIAVIYKNMGRPDEVMEN